MRKIIFITLLLISVVSYSQKKDTIQLHPITDSLRVDLIEYIQVLKKSNMGIMDYEKAVNILEGFFLYNADKRKKIKR